MNKQGQISIRTAIKKFLGLRLEGQKLQKSEFLDVMTLILMYKIEKQCKLDVACIFLVV